MASEDRTSLHVAAAAGDLIKVKEILKDPKSELDPKDDLGWTPLMIACSAGRVDIVKELISAGVDVNASNNNGQVPLHYAASKAHVEIFKLLLDHGANVNHQDKYGSTPLHRAASKGNLQIVKMLLESPRIRVDAQDAYGNTPLHYACEEERLAECRLLIESGSDLDLENLDQKKPLDMCERSVVKDRIISGRFDETETEH